MYLVVITTFLVSFTVFILYNGYQAINVSTERLKWRPMIRRIEEITYHLTLHVRVASDTQTIQSTCVWLTIFSVCPWARESYRSGRTDWEQSSGRVNLGVFRSSYVLAIRTTTCKKTRQDSHVLLMLIYTSQKKSYGPLLQAVLWRSTCMNNWFTDE